MLAESNLRMTGYIRQNQTNGLYWWSDHNNLDIETGHYKRKTSIRKKPWSEGKPKDITIICLHLTFR